MNDFLSLLLANQSRARVIRTFISNESERMSVATIARRSGVSPRAAKLEITALLKMKLISQSKHMVPAIEGKKRAKKRMRTEDVWGLVVENKYVRALTSFVHEVSPAQYQDVERALKSTGRLSTVILSGLFVGDPSRPADLIISGDSVNERRVEKAVRTLEPKFGREIRYTILSTPEFRYRLTVQDRLLRDVLDFPHRILINRAGILK